MPPSQQTFDNGDEKLPPALLKVDGAAGGGGRKAKTRAGAGNTGDGGAARIFSGPEDRDPGRSVLHRHLKDIAVDALELAQGKDIARISLSIKLVMNSYDMSEQMAEILTSLVLSAYECVLQGADDRTVYQAFSCFSDEQLERIIGIARRQ